MVLTTKAKTRMRSTLITLGVAACLVILGTAALGTFIAQAEQAGAGASGSAPVDWEGAVSSEVGAPEGLTVKVDDRGIELLEDDVSAQYAVAVAAELAKRVYGQTPTNRAQAVLYNSRTTYLQDVDQIDGLYWNVLLETENGTVSAVVAASTGIDCRSDYSAFQAEDWKAAFDNWNGSPGGDGAYFGTEAELVAQQEEVRARYGDDYGKSSLSEAELARMRADKAALVLQFAAEHEQDPHPERAVELANEYGLGNGATAVSGRTVTKGAGGAFDDNPPEETYLVDVELDDGAHLFVCIGKDSQSLYGYERSALDYLTLHYS